MVCGLGLPFEGVQIIVTQITVRIRKHRASQRSEFRPPAISTNEGCEMWTGLSCLCYTCSLATLRPLSLQGSYQQKTSPSASKRKLPLYEVIVMETFVERTESYSLLANCHHQCWEKSLITNSCSQYWASHASFEIERSKLDHSRNILAGCDSPHLSN